MTRAIVVLGFCFPLGFRYWKCSSGWDTAPIKLLRIYMSTLIF